jgi:hypothetical protein
MLRTNLSSRPFYNERLVHLVLGTLAVLVAAVTALNAWQIITLSARDASLRQVAGASDRDAAATRSTAERIRASVDPKALEVTASAASEANAIIERRAFSWTGLFNRFEATLPDTVRIASVRPQVHDDGTVTVIVAVVARNVDGVDTFIENLERDAAFRGFLSTEEFVNDEGLLEAKLVGTYAPGRTPSQAGGAR